MYLFKGGRVLDVVEERTEGADTTLIEKALIHSQKMQITAVALDMWKAYANAVTTTLPEAVIVHDRFHVSQHMNKAVDKVRRQENRQLIKQGDERLKGKKYLWLTNEENKSEEHAETFDYLKRAGLKVSRAGRLKNCLETFGRTPMQDVRGDISTDGIHGLFEVD